jgi:hypothetical protein
MSSAMGTDRRARGANRAPAAGEVGMTGAVASRAPRGSLDAVATAGGAAMRAPRLYRHLRSKGCAARRRLARACR